MATIQPLTRTTEWTTRPAVAVSDVLAKSATPKNAGASFVTTERDGYEKTSLVTAERDGYGEVAKSAVGGKPDSGQAELREVFDDFVGQTFYSQMLERHAENSR